MNNKSNSNDLHINGCKKEWHTPVVTNYGDVAEITRQIKAKQAGFQDDFGVTGVEDPS